MKKRALLLFPMADGQTGPAIKYAFEKLDYAVKSVDAKLQPQASYSVAYRYKPDLVFCSRTVELTEQVAQIKRKFPDAIVCMWNVDMRENIEAWKHLYPLIRLCDYHFVPDAGHIQQWRELNRNTFWLPQGLQDEVYDKPKEITDVDREKYSCDVSFAGGITGSLHRQRCQYLEAVKQTGAELKLWGCDGNPRVRNEEHNKMVALSKINIACTSPGLSSETRKKGTSVRVYKILGAGGFALELQREGIHEIFPKNVLKCYTSPEDLAKKVRYWLDHDWERWQIADTAYRWVRENATYTHRMRDALKHMEM